MRKLGLGFYASSVDNIWPAVVACQPRALVVLDSKHLPLALPPADQQYWLWRPWIWDEGEAPRPMNEVPVEEWLSRAERKWHEGRDLPFHGIQFLNEPRVECPGWSAEGIMQWGGDLVPLIRQKWPQAEIHSPPLSPMVPGWTQFYLRLRPLISICDVLNVHTYLNDPGSYLVPAALYADKPLVISECGDGQKGTAAYGQALLRWLQTLPPYVGWAAVYVYNSTNGQNPDWELYQSDALQVLIEAGA
jgi:hypothetical protein